MVPVVVVSQSRRVDWQFKTGSVGEDVGIRREMEATAPPFPLKREPVP